MKDQAKDFGAWLRAQRTLQQLSIDEACKRADVSRDRWTTLEKGGRTVRGEWVVANPRPQMLVAIAQSLGLDTVEVFSRAGVAMPPELRPLIKANNSDGEEVLVPFHAAITGLVAQVEALNRKVDEIQTLMGKGGGGSTPGDPPARGRSRRPRS